MNDTESLALFKICAQLQKEVHDIKSENDLHCGAISCLESKIKKLENDYGNLQKFSTDDINLIDGKFKGFSLQCVNCNQILMNVTFKEMNLFNSFSVICSVCYEKMQDNAGMDK